MTTAAAPAWPVWIGLGLYTALRLALLPTDGEVVLACSHDSAYIAIVAGNLVAGRGYVNDAHWLVFLQPASLPMPYHNANPLYPTAVAAVMALTGRDAVWSGLALSAVASSLLFAAVFELTRLCADRVWQRAVLAAAVTFFPAVFVDSLQMLPDALCTALQAWSAVCLFRWPGLRGAVAAGVLFGLAWLTRSSAVLALPAVAVFLWRRDGWRTALKPGVAFTVAALLAALPWLVHTAAIWGSPFRSDAGHYLWQDYYAYRRGTDVERYWHSPEPPPPLGEVVRDDPGGFAQYQARGVPVLLLGIVARWTDSQPAVALLLTGLAAGAAWLWRGRVRPTPEVLALALFALISVAAYVPRARSMELRYVEGVSALLALVLVLPVVQVMSWAALRRSPTVEVAALAALWWLVWTPAADVRAWLQLYRPDPERVALRADYREAAGQFGRGRPVVVGTCPYHYRHYTGEPALAMPAADDDYLRAYMQRYGARWVILTDAERDAWRPRWRGRDGLPAWVRLVGRVGQLTVFERTQ